jgi:SAM-dependent methyltransferase
LTRTTEVADIGSGPGNLTALLLPVAARVYGVEPNKEMREAAERLLVADNFVSIDGTAEHTGLPDASVDLVTASQAFHWFDREKARNEFGRIVRDGFVALIWNRRLTDSSEFLQGYDELLGRYSTEYRDVDHSHAAREELSAFFGRGGFESRSFPNQQLFNWEGLLGRVMSSSYVPLEGESHDLLVKGLEELFAKHEQHGQVAFLYKTQVFWEDWVATRRRYGWRRSELAVERELPPNPESSWQEYFAAMADKPLHPLYAHLDPFLPPTGRALELGCGVGQGVLHLAALGWDVVAVDAQDEPLNALRARLEPRHRVEIRKGFIEDVKLNDREFDLVVAGFCLFFLKPTEFGHTLERTLGSIRPGGLLMAQFLGPWDSWAREGYSAHSQEDLRSFLSGFQTLHWEHIERDGRSVQGTPKHWDVTHVIARKPKEKTQGDSRNSR